MIHQEGIFVEAAATVTVGIPKNPQVRELRLAFAAFEAELKIFNRATYDGPRDKIIEILKKIPKEVEKYPTLADEDLATAVAETGIRFGSYPLTNTAGNILGQLVHEHPRMGMSALNFLKKVIRGGYISPENNSIRHDFVKEHMGDEYDPLTCKTMAVRDALVVAERVIEAAINPPDEDLIDALTNAALRRTENNALVFGNPLKPLRAAIARNPGGAKKALELIDLAEQDAQQSLNQAVLKAAQEAREEINKATGVVKNFVVESIRSGFAEYESAIANYEEANHAEAKKKLINVLKGASMFVTVYDSSLADGNFAAIYTEAGFRFSDKDILECVTENLGRLVENHRSLAVATLGLLKEAIRGDYEPPESDIPQHRKAIKIYGPSARLDLILCDALDLTETVVEDFAQAADVGLAELVTSAALRIKPDNILIGEKPLVTLGKIIGLNAQFADHALDLTNAAENQALSEDDHVALNAATKTREVILDAIAHPLDPEAARTRRTEKAFASFGLGGH